MSKTLRLVFMIIMILLICDSPPPCGDASSDKAPKSQAKSKFYDFSDQLIDGTIAKPTTLYTDARTQVKFERLLSLKKSFLKSLYETAKEKVFK